MSGHCPERLLHRNDVEVRTVLTESLCLCKVQSRHIALTFPLEAMEVLGNTHEAAVCGLCWQVAWELPISILVVSFLFWSSFLFLSFPSMETKTAWNCTPAADRNGF